MKKEIYIILRETASDFKHGTSVLLVTSSFKEASETFNEEAEKARTIAEENGYSIDCAGDDAFESYDDRTAAEYYNVRLIKTELNGEDKLPVGEKMLRSLRHLQTIPGSGYWPYASPAPCSTEVAIRKSLDQAIVQLGAALDLHETMFGKTGRDCMNAPSTKIRQA